MQSSIEKVLDHQDELLPVRAERTTLPLGLVPIDVLDLRESRRHFEDPGTQWPFHKISDRFPALGRTYSRRSILKYK